MRRPAREAADADPPRAAAVADALTTAFMLLWDADIDALCAHAPGLEAWILDDGPDPAAQLRHVRG